MRPLRDRVRVVEAAVATGGAAGGTSAGIAGTVVAAVVVVRSSGRVAGKVSIMRRAIASTVLNRGRRGCRWTFPSFPNVPGWERWSGNCMGRTVRFP